VQKVFNVRNKTVQKTESAFGKNVYKVPHHDEVVENFEQELKETAKPSKMAYYRMNQIIVNNSNAVATRDFCNSTIKSSQQTDFKP